MKLDRPFTIAIPFLKYKRISNLWKNSKPTADSRKYILNLPISLLFFLIILDKNSDIA
jgi:hypothetical protein